MIIKVLHVWNRAELHVGYVSTDAFFYVLFKSLHSNEGTRASIARGQELPVESSRCGPDSVTSVPFRLAVNSVASHAVYGHLQDFCEFLWTLVVLESLHVVIHELAYVQTIPTVKLLTTTNRTQHEIKAAVVVSGSTRSTLLQQNDGRHHSSGRYGFC